MLMTRMHFPIDDKDLAYPVSHLTRNSESISSNIIDGRLLFCAISDFRLSITWKARLQRLSWQYLQVLSVCWQRKGSLLSFPATVKSSAGVNLILNRAFGIPSLCSSSITFFSVSGTTALRFSDILTD